MSCSNSDIEIIEGSGNIFKDLGFDEDESAALLARAHLSRKILDYIDNRDWNQKEAADFFGISQPRMSDLRNGKMHKFSTEFLIEMLVQLDASLAINIDGESFDLRPHK